MNSRPLAGLGGRRVFWGQYIRVRQVFVSCGRLFLQPGGPPQHRRTRQERRFRDPIDWPRDIHEPISTSQ